MTVPLIEFKNVTKRFGNRTVLDCVNLKIYDNQVTTIIGKSGTGKSVLLKHIIGLLKPDHGSVLFRGQPLKKMSRREWNSYIGQISYMFQNNALFDSLSVFDNVALPLRNGKKLSKRKIRDKVMARLEQTELSEAAHKYPAEISGGMQKRTALARALVTDPNIVLFDELTTGQDPIRRNVILGMIAGYRKKFGFTAVLISHDIPDVFFISNQVLALYDKQIIFQGSPAELENFNHPFLDEITESIENLQDELTGLYSKRQFKVRYQTDLGRRNEHNTYAAVVFSLEDFDAINESLGYTATQKCIRAMGKYIDHHFGAVGGFSARRSINQFETVLPFSDLDEASRIMKNFVEDFRGNGLKQIIKAAKTVDSDIDCFEFSILAGLALGKPVLELDSVMQFAELSQKPIAQLQCEIPTADQKN